VETECRFTALSKLLIEKLTVIQDVKKYISLYVNGRFVTVLSKGRHLTTS